MCPLLAGPGRSLCEGIEWDRSEGEGEKLSTRHPGRPSAPVGSVSEVALTTYLEKEKGFSLRCPTRRGDPKRTEGHSFVLDTLELPSTTRFQRKVSTPSHQVSPSRPCPGVSRPVSCGSSWAWRSATLEPRLDSSTFSSSSSCLGSASSSLVRSGRGLPGGSSDVGR